MAGAEPTLKVREIEPIPALNALLGKAYELGGANAEEPIGILANDMVFYFANREQQNGMMVEIQLKLLAKHLKEVQEYSEDAFSRFRQDLRAAGEMDAYEAARFELDTAASLARCRRSFVKREAPDFEVTTDYGTAHIECGSVHLTLAHRNDASYKIQSVCRSKGLKPYCNRATALFVDATAYMHRAISRQTLLSRDEMTTLLQGQLMAHQFGSVVLFYQLVRKGEGKVWVEIMYQREDSAEIERSLLDVLDRCWPKGTTSRNDVGIPGAG